MIRSQIVDFDDSGDPGHIPVLRAVLAVSGNLDPTPPIVALLYHMVYVILCLALAYSILDYEWWKFCLTGRLKSSVKVTIEVSVDATTSCNVQVFVGDTVRADKQPPSTPDRIRLAKQSYCVNSFDDGKSFNEGTFSSSGYCTGGSNYSEQSYRAKIVGGGNVKLTPSMLQGAESVADKGCSVQRDNIKALQEASPKDDRFNSSSIRAVLQSEASSTYGSTVGNAMRVKHAPGDIESIHAIKQKTMGRKQKESPLLYTQDPTPELSKRQIRKEPVKSLQGAILPSHSLPRVGKANNGSNGYNKPTYAVLIGNHVKVYSATTFASLPKSNKFLVKERRQDAFGVTKVKLTLKQSTDKTCNSGNTKYTSDEDAEKDGAESYGEKIHYRENLKRTGYVIYTCYQKFVGNIKYPLPNNKATDSKIGRGGNGFVFTIYHERRQYAVKKTVYRPNEINVHSALNHANILPLVAVLMGEKHERHSSKFYCFHFMPKMDYDLRQILSTKEVGCLKHFYNYCSAHKEPNKWDIAFKNVKFILKETLKAISYLHRNGYVHRDIKASNIMIKMRCQCQPLSCICKAKFQVKLGDFDSAGTIPGLGITEPTDQIIKFASILPLGTPGYRAPEVSMHITLSGPYETLYTTAVDMWSFGCLCLNICIGKTAALKQREEASLLLSLTHPTCAQELWEKTTKIKQLEKSKPFSNDFTLIKLVHDCLKVLSAKRPSAEVAIQQITMCSNPW